MFNLWSPLINLFRVFEFVISLFRSEADDDPYDNNDLLIFYLMNAKSFVPSISHINGTRQDTNVM
jgi:ubiquitin-protein ligase